MKKIFLDDERLPDFIGWDGFDVIRVRDYYEFIESITKYNGEIESISFDHDLGLSSKSGYDCIRWLEEQVYHKNIKCPGLLQVHSMNPVGAKRIRQTIDMIQMREAHSR